MQAYYVIKAAQEREELQREGDILDGRIQTAEREVRGLEATLAKLNLVNNDMGKSFRHGIFSELATTSHMVTFEAFAPHLWQDRLPV